MFFFYLLSLIGLVIIAFGYGSTGNWYWLLAFPICMIIAIGLTLYELYLDRKIKEAKNETHKN